MLSLTKLLCNSNNFGDDLRYSKGAAQCKYGVNFGRGPVVVWNCTRQCNLKCLHCYAEANNEKCSEELELKEARDFIEDLKMFNVPVILFSGGEPLLRGDFFNLLELTSKLAVRSTISTNGTLLYKDVCKDIKSMNVGYVGVSLDGIGSRHDEFRGVSGAFDKSLKGIRNCIELNQRVGLRFTINKHNFHQIEEIFALIKEEKIPRVCFYHMVYSGRASNIIKDDISKEQRREVMDLIIKKTLELGPKFEILTVDNHADSVYLYLKALKEFPNKANRILQLINSNGGNRSGMAFACVDYKGDIHPDQFTWQYTFGNIKQNKFSDIWKNSDNSILNGLRNRKALIKGRCSKCKWIFVCNANFRTRAEVVYKDFWESDPACYLTDNEIGI
ncbi:radical SAM/SPASM domain-containing protein [Clostridium rectalis]|uniref:radical SAM/SPASM domain-containing protein n=1 Tax=Clostridium rectalis TaxID=2040295 RepID=UPI000F62F0C2|nr:radical SAM protein [Clostridium rectalis]